MMNHFKEQVSWSNKKHLVSVIVTLFIFAAIPLTVFVSITQRDLRGRAVGVENLVGVSQETSFVSNELLIKLKPSVKNAVKEGNPNDTGIVSLNKLNNNFGVKKFEKVFKAGKKSNPNAEIFNWYKITLEGKSEKVLGRLNQISGKLESNNPAKDALQEVVTAFRAEPSVLTVEPNYSVLVSNVPNDPYFSSSGSWGQSYQDLWGIHKIKAELAWDTITASDSIVVADIDTGVDRNHEDLKDNMWVNSAEIPGNKIDDDGNGYIDDYFGWDWVNNDNDPMDDHGHGTHTVGTIAAAGNNGVGVVGVNWKAKVMALKFLSASGSGVLDTGAKALQYAADMGARVSSNSWGCSCQSSIIDDAVKYEHDRGMVVVVAAGNNNGDALNHSPASVAEAITIAASDPVDVKATFSNWGEKIDVAAPGVDTLSTRAAVNPMCTADRTVGTNYCRVSGTSMATPHVAGLATLILAKNPTLKNEEVRQILRFGADDLGTAGKDRDFGFGRINATNSINLATVSPLTPIITSPRNRERVLANTVEILGSVAGPNFKNYKVEMGIGRLPTSWTLLKDSPTQITSNGVLATADISTLPENTQITFRLSAYDVSGKSYQFQVFDYTIDNLEAIITSPLSSVYGDIVEINGTARSKNGGVFDRYILEYGEGVSPASWISTGITTENSGLLPVVNGKLGAWDIGNLKNNVAYTLRLTVKGRNGNSEQAKATVIADRELLIGWPKTFDTTATVGQPAIGDLNNDGKEEIVVSENNKIHVFAKDGSYLPGWPISLPSVGVVTSLLLSDLNNDGTKEVVVNGTSYIAHILKYDGTLLPGWPQPLGGFYRTSVGDLDGNGTKELVSFERSHYEHDLKVIARNLDGSLVSGFPKTIYTNATQTETSGSGEPQAVLIDLENDGKMEMVLRTIFENTTSVFVLDFQGNVRAGWPKTISGYSPIWTSAGDITGDGKKEVIVYYQVTNVSGGSYSIDVFDSQGNRLPNFPQEAARGVGRMGPALADVTGDGVVDIVLPHYGDGTSKFGASPMVFTRDGRRGSVYNSPNHTELPAIFDFNGDGQPEVASSPGSRGVNVLSRSFDATGNLVWSEIWKKATNGYTSPIVVADMDKNGKWEIVMRENANMVGTAGKILVWEPTTSNSNLGTSVSWPQYRKDEAKSSIYLAAPGTPPSDSVPPTITISSPSNGQTVSGTVNFYAVATDNVGVTRVEFFVDGTPKAVDNSSPYQYFWDTKTVNNGSHQLTARAYDAAGNLGIDGVSITVQNGDTIPPSTPTGLTASASSYNRINLAWTASTDNVGVVGYWVVRNGTTIATSSTNTYSDTGVNPSTTYSYQVIAFDAAGNFSAPSNTSLATTPAAPDTQAPSAPTNLVAAAVSSSQINLSWNASVDNIGVTAYEIWRNGSLLTTIGNISSFGDSGLTASTTYSYFIKAKDAAGNVSVSSSAVSATTQNPPTTGTISGTVRDTSSNPLGGVRVQTTVSGSKFTIYTSSTGYYYFPTLQPGSYSVKFSARGFTSVTDTVQVSPGITTTHNVTLSVRKK